MPLVEDLPALFTGDNKYVSIPPVDPLSTFGGNLVIDHKPTLRHIALQDFQSFSSVVKGVAARNAAMTGGAPEWVAKPLVELFTKLPLVGGGDLVSFTVESGIQVAKAILTEVAVSVSTMLSDSLSAQPIVKAVVDFLLFFVKTVQGIVWEQRNPNNWGPGRPVMELARLSYDWEEDQAQGNALIDYGSEPDWTDLFMPTSSDPDFKVNRLTDAPGSISVQWASAVEGSWGLVPGLSTQLRSYQSLRGAAPITDGNRLPSGRKFAMLLWQAAMKPSVMMFQIDSHKVESAWEGYFEALWKLADRDLSALDVDDFSLMWLKARIRQSASYSRLYECEGAGKPDKIMDCRGKPPVFKPESVISGFTRAMLAKKVKLTGLYSDIVKYVCITHRERARAALGTLVCAYVPPSAPLLTGDPAALKMHSDMRILLLEDPAVMQVELALIPDAEYRADVQRAQFRRPDLGLKAGGRGKRPKPGVIPAVMATLNLPPPPDAPPVGIPEGVSPSPKGDVGTGLYLAAGAVALVGGALVVRKLWR